MQRVLGHFDLVDVVNGSSGSARDAGFPLLAEERRTGDPLFMQFKPQAGPSVYEDVPWAPVDTPSTGSAWSTDNVFYKVPPTLMVVELGSGV